MKRFKKVTRILALILFMLLATAGIATLGMAPPLTKDRKLFTDTEMVQTEQVENNDDEGLEMKNEKDKR